jgi:hypothetical protein
VTIVSDACTTNIINDASRSVNHPSSSVIDDSIATVQIVVSLYDHHDGHNMFIVQATELLIESE